MLPTIEKFRGSSGAGGHGGHRGGGRGYGGYGGSSGYGWGWSYWSPRYVWYQNSCNTSSDCYSGYCNKFGFCEYALY